MVAAGRMQRGLRAGRWGTVARAGGAVVIALLSANVLAASVGAEAPDADTVTTGASNGGSAYTSTGGDVTIGAIITGENTGNAIATGDIAGVAEITGGVIDYPTEIDVTLIIEPSIADASGGAAGSARSGAADGAEAADVDIDNKNVNRNTNNNSSESG